MKETNKPEARKRTYPQEWRCYNAAQVNEKGLFQPLLSHLCRSITDTPQTKGRPRHPLSDIIFGMAFKVYTKFPARRFMTDLREAQVEGYLSRAPSYNALFDYFEMESVTEHLRRLIIESSRPLSAIEQAVAIDASGFRTVGYVRWFNARYGKEQDNHDWVKLHLSAGVLTNVVMAVELSNRHAHDSPFFETLLNTTVESGFSPREVYADKAYSSRANLRLVKQHGGTAYIDFKDNAKGGSDCEVWDRAFYYYSLHKEEFYERYHQRSNVETTFWMIKSKFDEAVRSKTQRAQINEVLCKVLCHNICCLIQSMYELGISPTFRAELVPARIIT